MDDSPVRRFYEQYDEHSRLDTGPFRLEHARTSVLMRELLPPPPAIVLDVGGGPGVYACELAAGGYTVHLIDLVPKLVEQAQARAHALSAPLASVRVGDARALDDDDACADAVLLFGPLYHLQSREDRLRALREAMRVLRPGGVLLAAGISRYASLIDGFLFGAIDDPRFADIVSIDLDSGCHHNPTDNINWFTDAYFHEPSELASELTEAGFGDVDVRAIEGFGWLLADLDARWADDARRSQLLEWIARTDRVSSMLGVSAHVLGYGRKRKGVGNRDRDRDRGRERV